MEIGNNYKSSKTLDETNANFEVIKSWWHLSRATSGNDLEKPNHWLTFWHFQFHKLGNFV
jgi:hypothetical protein